MAREPFPTPRSNYTLISGASHGTVTLLVSSDHPIDRSIASFEFFKSRAFAWGCDGLSAMIRREIKKAATFKTAIKELHVTLVSLATECSTFVDTRGSSMPSARLSLQYRNSISMQVQVRKFLRAMLRDT